MGNNNSHIAFETDGQEGVTFLKGIRLSDKVIDRMKESPSKASPHSGQKAASSPPQTVPATPQPRPMPTAERTAPVLPQYPHFVSHLMPPPPIEPVPIIESLLIPPPQQSSEEVKTQLPVPPKDELPTMPTPPTEGQVTPTPSVPVASPPLLLESVASSSTTPLTEPTPPPVQATPTVVPLPLAPPPPIELLSSTTPPPVETPTPPPSVEHIAEFTPKVEPEVIQQPAVEPAVIPVLVEPVTLPTPPPSVEHIAESTPVATPEVIQQPAVEPTVTSVVVEPAVVPVPSSVELLSSTTPVETPTPLPSVEHIAESTPNAESEVIQQPAVEPTVISVAVEPVAMPTLSSVELVSSTTPPPVETPTPPPTVEHIFVFTPIAEPEVIQQPAVEPTVIPEVVEPAAVPVPSSVEPLSATTLLPVETPTPLPSVEHIAESTLKAESEVIQHPAVEPTVLSVAVESVAMPTPSSVELVSTTPPPVETPTPPPSVEHIAESTPIAEPEAIQQPAVEPAVISVVVEPVAIPTPSFVESLNVSSPPGESVALSTTPSEGPIVILQSSPDEPLAVHVPPSVVPVAEPTPAPTGPVIESSPPVQPLDTPVQPVELVTIPTLPVEALATPAHSEESVIPISHTVEPEPVVTSTCDVEPVPVSVPMETTAIATPAEVISLPVLPADPLVSTSTCEPKDVPSSSPVEVETTPTLPPTESIGTPSVLAPPTPVPVVEEIETIAMPSPSSAPPSVPLPDPEERAETPPVTPATTPPASELLALPSGLDSLTTPSEKPVDAHPIPSLLDTMSPPPQPPPPQTPVVSEDELRTQIKGELQRLLEQEMSQTQLRIQKQLEEEKLRARAVAQAAAQVQIQQQVKKVLDEEKAARQKSLKEAILKERMNTEDERLIAQYYAQKLEERDEDLKKQDALYREQLNKLEEKSTKFYKVTTQSFHKGKEDAHNRFTRYDIKPVCSDLQEQILRCYKDNKGQTLACSSIASLYIQCVDKAKQV